MKKLAYLDLQVKTTNKRSITLKEVEHSCYFDRKYDHELHGENKQANSLIDLVLNLGFGIELLEEKYKELIIPTQNMLKTILQNQEYMKNQLTTILSKFQKLEQNQITISDNILKSQVQGMEQNLHEIIDLVKETKRIVLG